VQAWIRGTSLSPATARGVFAVLSMVMSAAVDDSLIQRNPCRVRSVRPPRADKRKVVPWQAAAVDAVRAGLPARYRALADAGRGLGLRLGEAVGLAVDDVDFLRRVVHERRQVKRLGNGLVFAPPKGGRERDVPLPASVGLPLSAHVAEFPPIAVALPWRIPEAEPVTVRLLFTNTRGAAISSRVFDSAQWHPALRTAGHRGVEGERVPRAAAPLRVGPAARRGRHRRAGHLPRPPRPRLHPPDLRAPDAGCSRPDALGGRQGPVARG
jgi:integrase